ncbi:MAG: hypothetical protein K0S27_977 [Gammaproteobacteria bacterium]|jgi:hypothetical protein|nr:hypothetical protein [Gammaproteobacteria bacterium]
MKSSSKADLNREVAEFELLMLEFKREKAALELEVKEPIFNEDKIQERTTKLKKLTLQIFIQGRSVAKRAIADKNDAILRLLYINKKSLDHNLKIFDTELESEISAPEEDKLTPEKLIAYVGDLYYCNDDEKSHQQIEAQLKELINDHLIPALENHLQYHSKKSKDVNKYLVLCREWKKSPLRDFKDFNNLIEINNLVSFCFYHNIKPRIFLMSGLNTKKASDQKNLVLHHSNEEIYYWYEGKKYFLQKGNDPFEELSKKDFETLQAMFNHQDYLNTISLKKELVPTTEAEEKALQALYKIIAHRGQVAYPELQGLVRSFHELAYPQIESPINTKIQTWKALLQELEIPIESPEMQYFVNLFHHYHLERDAQIKNQILKELDQHLKFLENTLSLKKTIRDKNFEQDLENLDFSSEYSGKALDAAKSCKRYTQEALDACLEMYRNHLHPLPQQGQSRSKIFFSHERIELLDYLSQATSLTSDLIKGPIIAKPTSDRLQKLRDLMIKMSNNKIYEKFYNKFGNEAPDPKSWAMMAVFGPIVSIALIAVGIALFAIPGGQVGGALCICFGAGGMLASLGSTVSEKPASLSALKYEGKFDCKIGFFRSKRNDKLDSLRHYKLGNALNMYEVLQRELTELKNRQHGKREVSDNQLPPPKLRR